MEKFFESQRSIAVDHDPFNGSPIDVTYPTTDPQREVWLASQMGDDANCAYNESVSLRLKGVLDRNTIDKAVSLTVERHGSLRSVFSGSGMQMIEMGHAEQVMTFHDLAGSTEEDRVKRMSEIDHDLMTVPFDLFAGPLFKTVLIRLAEEEHVLRFVAHHGICDGWSLGIVMSDVSKMYSALLKGATPDLPEAVPYGHYAAEIANYQASEAYEKVERYWIDLYSGTLPRMDLPTDRPRTTIKTYSADRIDLPLAADLVKGLKQIGIRYGSSLVTTLLTTFELLIARKTGRIDLVIGLPAAGQSETGMKELVGHCVSLLPLRSTLDPERTFSAHLKQRRSAILDAYDHQRFSLGTLLQIMEIPREPGRVPLAPVVFNIDMNMDDGVDFAGLTHAFSSDPRKFEQFELALNCVTNGDELVLEWGYNTGLFDPSTIHAWMDELVEIMRSICKDPEITLAEAIGVDRFDTTGGPVPRSWSGQLAPIPETTTVWSVFKAVVEKRGDRTAIVQGDRTMLYSELRDHAVRSSMRVSNAGVEKGDLVGIFTTPGPDMIVALLAVIRAGAAYVPIDPGYPQERIVQILKDADVKLVLTLPDLLPLLPDHSLAMIIDEGTEAVDPRIDGPSVEISSEDPAYVIYTSGSTGIPKGVVVPHRGVVRLVDPGSFVAFGPELTWLHHLSISFDASMLSIWGALLNGGKLAIPEEVKPSLNHLADTIIRHDVNAIATASGLFELLVEERIDALKGLQHLITGGDVISLRHARRVFEEVGPGVLVNVYGPTENSVASSSYVLQGEEALGRAIPIGKPFLNSLVYVLDEEQKPVSIGQRGELYTAGPGTALGYLNRPELNAERFLDDPFDPGGRMYRTGDMVRWLPSGDLEFFGRQDDQVKIRGFRIELGEIDAAMNDLVGIASKAVISASAGDGEKEILVYVVADGSEVGGPVEQHVLAHLSRKLPEHMLPSMVIQLDAMPLNRSGKVDKAKLPRPDRGVHAPRRTYVAPNTEIERSLAGIWSKLLELNDVGIHDNFFELGGHSLTGLQMFAQVERQLGTKLQLKTLFQTPTIRQLAELIEKEGVTQQWKNLIAIRPNGGRIPFFLVHGDQANNFLPPYIDKDRPFYGFAHQGENGEVIEYTSIPAIAKHLITELRMVMPEGPYLLGGYSFGGVVAFEMAQQLIAVGEDVPLLALLDSYAPPDYRAVMKRERKFHEPLKDYLVGLLLDRYRSIGGIMPEWLRHSNIMHTYNKAMRLYDAAPYNGRITLFRCRKSIGPLEMGWTDLAKGGVEVILMEGDHFDLMKDQQVKRIASELNRLFETDPRVSFLRAS